MKKICFIVLFCHFTLLVFSQNKIPTTQKFYMEMFSDIATHYDSIFDKIDTLYLSVANNSIKKVVKSKNNVIIILPQKDIYKLIKNRGNLYYGMLYSKMEMVGLMKVRINFISSYYEKGDKDTFIEQITDCNSYWLNYSYSYEKEEWVYSSSGKCERNVLPATADF